MFNFSTEYFRICVFDFKGQTLMQRTQRGRDSILFRLHPPVFNDLNALNVLNGLKRGFFATFTRGAPA
jgi:hypothetical protein